MRIIAFTLLVVFGFINSTFAHEHHPPHQGVLVVLGEEFAHLELVLDSDKGVLTAYSLDGEAENAIPLDRQELVFKITPAHQASFNLSLKAVENPLTGETVGHTSEFSAQSDSLKGVKNFFAVIDSVTTKGQEFKDVNFGYPEGNDHDQK